MFLCVSKFQMENKKTLITFKLGLEGIFVGIVILYVVALAATVTHECSFKPLKTNVCSFDKSIYCTQACNFTFLEISVCLLPMHKPMCLKLMLLYKHFNFHICKLILLCI